MQTLVACLFFLAVTSPALGIDTVKSLNVTAYLGRWYQVYSDWLVMETFERNGVCVTADYSLRKDGITVVNRQRTKTPTGDLKKAKGYAYTPDPKEPGKLKVHFDQPKVPFDGSYWIVKLGPVSGGQYEYSVVTDSHMFTLFVLARNVEEFKTKYDAEIKEFLTKNGFTHFYDKPESTLQTKECKYAPKPSGYQALRDYLAI